MRSLLAIFFFCSLILSGCQKSDNQLQPTTNQIARSWQNEVSTAFSVATGQSVVTYKRGSTAFDIWMNLAPDGVSSEYVDSQVSAGTWQLVDKQLRITNPGSTARTYELQTLSATNLTLLLVVPADTQDDNQKAFLSLMKVGVGLDISKGIRMTIQYSPR